MPTRYEKLTTRLQNHRLIAIVLVIGTIVIAISTFTDSTKNLIALFSKPSAEDARMKLASLTVPYTPEEFVESAARGDLTLVTLFLTAGMDPNTVLEGGPTALFLAARENHPQVVDALLAAGARVVNGDSNGVEAAAQSGNLGLLNRFLKTPPTHAALNEALVVAKNRAVLERLVGAGADLKVAGPEALLYASDPEAVTFLFSRGVSLNAKGANGRSLVENLSLERVNLDTLKILIERRADLDARDQSGDTLLIAMARRGFNRGTEMLLAGKASVDLADATGRTPLSFASELKGAKGLESVKLLLEHGASVSVKDLRGKTPLVYARENGNTEVAQLLVDRGAKE
ncbi:MAG: ankyrin repeat domain-containing protein [Opitutus sp.]